MRYNNEFEKYAIMDRGISSSSLHSFNDISMRGGGAGITPVVIEERPLNVTQIDVFSRLMLDRIIFLGVPIYDGVANIIQAQLLFLESSDAKRDIQIYINSPGGSVYSGLGIYDTMQYVAPKISTICTGMAASMAAVLLAAGEKGHRSALKHSRVMIHQPSGGASGQQTDIEISYKEITKLKGELYEILAEHTGQDVETIYKDSERDCWMTSIEAKEYHMIDDVLMRDDKGKKDAQKGGGNWIK